MNAIEINNLCKEYSGFRLDNINLTLPSGYIMGLIGENGAGKSTIIKLILDMIKRDSGTVTVLGKDNQTDFKTTKEDIGIVLDEMGFISYFNAKEIGKIMSKTFKNWDETQYDYLLKRFSIGNNKKYKDYSTGMKKKLGFAVAMSHGAKLLILDEATNGLDPVVRDEIIDLLVDFTRDENHSVLISSHIVSDLEKICDYIAFLHNGELMLCEEKDSLKDDYAFVRCSEEEFKTIESSAVIGIRKDNFGVDAIVKREFILKGYNVSAVTIEELFVFMVKGRV